MNIENVDRLLLSWSNEADPMTAMEIAKLWRCAYQTAAKHIRKMRAAGELDVCRVRRVSHTGQNQAINAYSPTTTLVRRRTRAACPD